MSLPGAQAGPVCGWCGRAAGPQCLRCGQAGLRALVVGAGRTAEELGRAFPAAKVLTSGRNGVIAEVGSAPAVIVATPGAEPRADGGYAAAVLLDGWALLGRASLRAAEEALRRWLNAAALVRPAAEDGSAVVVADAALPVVQALVRWDPVTHAERELAERIELRFPPGGQAGRADRAAWRRAGGAACGGPARGRGRARAGARGVPWRGAPITGARITVTPTMGRWPAAPCGCWSGQTGKTGPRWPPRCARRRPCAAHARILGVVRLQLDAAELL